MDSDKQIELARDYCKTSHAGQVRKFKNQPYHTHPVAVAEILARHGYDDAETQCVALLHDTLEDTEAEIGQIRKLFGDEIANGVFILSRNNRRKNRQELTHEEYIQRLSSAGDVPNRVKIADVIHNTIDLDTLPDESIERIIKYSNKYYIPKGEEIAPFMVQELIDNIKNYNKKLRQLC